MPLAISGPVARTMTEPTRTTTPARPGPPKRLNRVCNRATQGARTRIWGYPTQRASRNANNRLRPRKTAKMHQFRWFLSCRTRINRAGTANSTRPKCARVLGPVPRRSSNCRIGLTSALLLNQTSCTSGAILAMGPWTISGTHRIKTITIAVAPADTRIRRCIGRVAAFGNRRAA